MPTSERYEVQRQCITTLNTFTNKRFLLGKSLLGILTGVYKIKYSNYMIIR